MWFLFHMQTDMGTTIFRSEGTKRINNHGRSPGLCRVLLLVLAFSGAVVAVTDAAFSSLPESFRHAGLAFVRCNSDAAPHADDTNHGLDLHSGEGGHVFQIFGYSEHRGTSTGEFIRSGTFSVGGHDWAVLFYPDWHYHPHLDHICVCLQHMSQDTQVWASCELRFIDQTTGLPSLLQKADMRLFNPGDYFPRSGLFLRRTDFEESVYLGDDHLTIECIVTTNTKQPRVSMTQFLNTTEAPQSSNITEQLGKLLEAEETTDVTFSVGEETIGPHKILLAARSPVFRAELYGPMKESMTQHVTIEDIQPVVFRALLHFIYTDSLPDNDQIVGESNSQLIWHLLVAADRYAVDRLKSLCQSVLCKNLDVETVSTTLALAYQHNCDWLKDICFEFISSSGVMDAVMATDGYKNLKTSCPCALIDMFEKTMRFHKT